MLETMHREYTIVKQALIALPSSIAAELRIPVNLISQSGAN